MVSPELFGVYTYLAANLEYGSGRSQLYGGLTIGTVYGADWASEYSGPFLSVTLPLRWIPYGHKMLEILVQSAMKAELFLVGRSNYPGSLFRQFINRPDLRKELKGLHSRTKHLLENYRKHRSDLEVTAFWSPAGEKPPRPLGFSIGVSGAAPLRCFPGRHAPVASFSYMEYTLWTENVRFL